MNGFKRGVRNLWRAPIRTVLLVAVLALGVGVFLTMAQAAQAIGARTDELAGSYQTLIEVRAAGATGMGVGADALPADFFEPAEAIDGVEDVGPYLYQRALDPSQPVPIAIFVGMRPSDAMRVAAHGEVGDPQVVAGRRLQPGDEGRPVAVIGTVYAEQYGLEPGGRLTLPPDRILADPTNPDPDAAAEPLQLEVVGIFDAGFSFGNNQVMLPLDVAQDAFAKDGKITHVFVEAASAGQVDDVEARLQEVFGERADIISGRDTAARFAATLGAIQTNSLLGAGIALVVSAIVIGFAMALVTAERRTEIGVLKALGASRGELTRQFLAEATALATAGALAGLALFWALGGVLGQALLGRAAATVPTMTAFGESPLQAVGIRLDTSLSTVALTLLGVVLLAAAGNLIPLIRTVRLEPAEAIRE